MGRSDEIASSCAQADQRAGHGCIAISYDATERKLFVQCNVMLRGALGERDQVGSGHPAGRVGDHYITARSEAEPR